MGQHACAPSEAVEQYESDVTVYRWCTLEGLCDCIIVLGLLTISQPYLHLSLSTKTDIAKSPVITGAL